jgi:hypothetical protein
MPWFPDFASAAVLARQERREAGQADPVAGYLELLGTGDLGAVEAAWPGEVTVDDPLAGEVRGHRELRRFVRHNRSWLGPLHPRTETVATTVSGGRAVVELLARLPGDGAELAWPVAVVSESPDHWSVTFRTYCRPWPVTGPHRVRPPVLPAGPDRPGDVVGQYQAALAAGDAEAAVRAFAADGYVREPGSGPQYLHRGSAGLRSFFLDCFSAGGGLGIQPCAVTDDGVRCALEYNCVRWGRHDLPPQAALTVYERGPDGLLAAARVYGDIAAPGGAGA